VEERVRRLVSRRLAGFAVVGIAVFLAGAALLFSLVHYLHVEPHVAYFITAIFSVESSFVLNRSLNWRDRPGRLAHQLATFHVAKVATIALVDVSDSVSDKQLAAARAYVDQRAPLQGKEDPPGSGRYPEPKWLGMAQHDMMLFDHGMPRADGTVPKEQRPEADVNIEFQSLSKAADGAQKLAWAFYAANEAYATDYPAAVGPHMTNTDSTPFMDLVPAISLRENERGREIGAGWDPHWHQPTDVYATFSDADFRLGLNAAQTTLGAIGRLTGATLNQ